MNKSVSVSRHILDVQAPYEEIIAGQWIALHCACVQVGASLIVLMTDRNESSLPLWLVFQVQHFQQWCFKDAEGLILVMVASCHLQLSARVGTSFCQTCLKTQNINFEYASFYPVFLPFLIISIFIVIN